MNFSAQAASRRRVFVAAAFIATALLAPTAQAALLETPLPSNAYITLNGFQWAWGSSCTQRDASDCDTPDIGFQQALGWRVAEASDMAIAPTALDFLFPGANVPFNGTDPVSGAAFEYLNAAYTSAASAGACASSYFTLGDGNNTCDWVNGNGQNVNTVGWFNQNGQSAFVSEMLFVRAVPEASSGAMLALGLAALALARRRRA